LKDGQDQINVTDVDTGRVWDCTINTAVRNLNEKMLTKGWWDYKVVKELRAGDMLECEIEDPPTNMKIKVYRGAGRRR
jgi:hypothetical protein